MARPQLLGATAAAILPAALSAAVLVSAPFAGTTTAPLADSTRVSAQPAADKAPAPAATAPAATAPAATNERAGTGVNLSVSTGSLATLVVGELMLVGVGGGVIVWARRRHYSGD